MKSDPQPDVQFSLAFTEYPSETDVLEGDIEQKNVYEAYKDSGVE